MKHSVERITHCVSDEFTSATLESQKAHTVASELEDIGIVNLEDFSDEEKAEMAKELRHAENSALAGLRMLRDVLAELTVEVPPRHVAQHDPTRVIASDVACRYIQMYGGRTVPVQREIDDCDVYLESPAGAIIGTVSMEDLFPKNGIDSILEDIPF